MKNLIKNILNEYFNEKNIILREINLPDRIFNLLITEGTATVKIPEGLESSLKKYISKKFNWPPTVDSKWCSDIKEKINKDGRLVKSCNKIFEIELTNHWLKRLFRKNEPEYQKGGKFQNKKFENPKKTEGIDLFFNSSKKINDFIDNSHNWQVNDSKLILLTDLSNKYQVIIELKKEKRSNYIARFITQIKGEKFFDTPELRKSIRL